MRSMHEANNLKKQYGDDKGLAIRTQLHSRYSTNKQGFFPWLFEQYRFFPNCRILELGCGNGAQWEGRIEALPMGCHLTLSDFSAGMVEAARKKYAPYSCVAFQSADIQNIPFPDESFDIVIANHMLYHVSDLDKALSEVRRVMTRRGVFYCATNGSGGMQPYLHQAIATLHPNTKAFISSFSFNLQNGAELLAPHFGQTERRDHIDSLAITKTQDLMDWLNSILSIASFPESDLEGMYDYFEAIRKREGSIIIPKETGLFISEK